MKKSFSVLFFLIGTISAMDNQEPRNQKFSGYSLDELISVRIAWAHQENRLGQLKYEASSISRSKKVDYFSGNKFVAIIDANDRTITTNIDNNNKQVKLSYEDFSTLLYNQEIIELANKRLEEQNNHSK